MRSIARVAWGIGLAAVISACGSEEPQQAMGRPMAQLETADRPDGENRAPVIERVVLRPPSPRPGERVTANVTASDPDGDRIRLTYQWTLGHGWMDGGPSLHVHDVAKGTPIEVRVIPTDGKIDGRPGTASASVGNQLPVLLGIAIQPPGDVTVEHDVMAIPRAMDPDGDALEYEFSWWVNGRRVDDADAVLPRSEFTRGDEISLAVVASDGTDESAPIESQPIAVRNAPPKIVSNPGDFEDDGSFLYPVAVNDPDGDRRFRFRLIDAPDGMRVDFVNGLVTWQPGEDDAGQHRVVLEVDDFSGGKTTQAFQVSVAFEAIQPPAAKAD